MWLGGNHHRYLHLRGGEKNILFIVVAEQQFAHHCSVYCSHPNGLPCLHTTTTTTTTTTTAVSAL